MDAELEADGAVVRAYLPNTARLHDLLVPGARLLLEPTTDPSRRTRYTATRVAAGSVWVALEASRAADLVATYLGRTASLPGIGPITGVEREITVGSHRIDLRLATPDGDPWLLEVKSLSRSIGGDAPLSATPSARGVAHLHLLADLALRGDHAAVAFVVQRGDVERLVVGPHADPAWIEAVGSAAEAGVAVLAFRCAVEPSTIVLERPLPVVLEDAPVRV